MCVSVSSSCGYIWAVQCDKGEKCHWVRSLIEVWTNQPRPKLYTQMNKLPLTHQQYNQKLCGMWLTEILSVGVTKLRASFQTIFTSGASFPCHTGWLIYAPPSENVHTLNDWCVCGGVHTWVASLEFFFFHFPFFLLLVCMSPNILDKTSCVEEKQNWSKI